MAQFHMDDTVCALSTPPGEGGIGMVRLSGKKALPIALAFFRSPQGKPVQTFESHRVYYGKAIDKEGKTIDEVMLSFFKAPKSYTREDVVEITAHGGMKILREILELMVEKGARPARPGEFTLRAFVNGRIDLAQAEAVLELIQAKTEGSREQALRHLQGEFSKEIFKLKERLIRLTAHVEAYVDFPEEDIEVYSQKEFLFEFEQIIEEIRKLIGSYQQGSLLRDGVLTVIVGKPNVGKSSLLNALLDRDRAIVSEIPGTTRDALEENLEMGGILIRIVDTAGIRPIPDKVESIGIRKTMEYLDQAQLVLMVLDGSKALEREDEDVIKKIAQKKCVLVVNKSDLPQKINLERSFREAGFSEKPPLVSISVKERKGFRELEEVISRLVRVASIGSESVFITKVRHKDALEKALLSLEKAKEAYLKQLSLEFIAFDLRESLIPLGEIVGEIYTDDILDKVFREFCIGK